MSPLTSDPNDPRLTHGADPVDAPGRDQANIYLVLSEEERAKGFVRPVRRSYIHDAGTHGGKVCGAVTTMGTALSETYARNPSFYGATYCVGCRHHRPVGTEGEFHWIEADGSTGPKVGT